MFNRVLHHVARFLPGSTGLRPFLHRLRGVDIQGKIFIGDDVYIENDFPQCLHIQDGVSIGLRSTIIVHTGSIGEHGKIVIEKNAVIMSCCTIIGSPGRTLTIGESSVVAAGSVVSNSIPAHTLCAGPRTKVIAEATVPFSLQTRYQDFLRGLRPIRTSAKKLK